MRPLNEWKSAYLDELVGQDETASFDPKNDVAKAEGVHLRLIKWVAWLEAMVNWALPVRLPLIASLYAAGLFVIVAMSACLPFSKPLLGLILAWIGLFFVFSVPIIVVTYFAFAVAIFHFIVGSIRRLMGSVCVGKPSTSKPERGGTRGTWDRWLDGIGG